MLIRRTTHEALSDPQLTPFMLKRPSLGQLPEMRGWRKPRPQSEDDLDQVSEEASVIAEGQGEAEAPGEGDTKM